MKASVANSFNQSVFSPSLQLHISYQGQSLATVGLITSFSPNNI